MSDYELEGLLNLMYPNRVIISMLGGCVLFNYNPGLLHGVNLKFTNIGNNRVKIEHFTFYEVDGIEVDIKKYLPPNGSALKFSYSFDATKDFRDISDRIDSKISKAYLKYSVTCAINDYNKSLLPNVDLENLNQRLVDLFKADFINGYIKSFIGGKYATVSINKDLSISLHLDKLNTEDLVKIVNALNE